MKKNLLTIAILSLTVILVAINITKPSLKENQQSKVDIEEKTTVSFADQKTNSLEKGAVAPDFELSTLDGKSIKLSDYRGQKVLLNFWATWCPPCKAEMPHMQNYYENNKDKNVTILAVNLTSMDKGIEKVKTFVKDYGLTFPIPMDEDGDVGDLYQAFTIPTSYILDEKGRIQQKIVGPMDEEMMSSLLEDK